MTYKINNICILGFLTNTMKHVMANDKRNYTDTILNEYYSLMNINCFQPKIRKTLHFKTRKCSAKSLDSWMRK